MADRLESIGRDVRVSFAYQEQALGLGHAVGCAAEAVGDEPFAVLLPDELMGDSSLLDQMARAVRGHRWQCGRAEARCPPIRSARTA